MWQKARIKHVERIEDTKFVGLELWLKGPPIHCDCHWCQINPERAGCYESNLCDGSKIASEFEIGRAHV